MSLQDYYLTLGLTPGATVSEVERAFKQKARRFHDDKQQNPEDKITARVEYDKIVEAKKIVLDYIKTGVSPTNANTPISTANSPMSSRASLSPSMGFAYSITDNESNNALLEKLAMGK